MDAYNPCSMFFNVGLKLSRAQPPKFENISDITTIPYKGTIRSRTCSMIGKKLDVTIAKWTSIQGRSKIYVILLQDLMKRGVCKHGVEMS
jgi:hypothetical protein